MTPFELYKPAVDTWQQWPSHVKVVQTTVGHATHSTSTTNHQDTHNQNENCFGYQNLAFHVNDNPSSVHQNRMRLLQTLSDSGVHQVHWLDQVHGITGLHITQAHKHALTPTQADALTTQLPHHALAIMTADCLPVVLTDAKGTEVAAIHAGWRGLQAGIIQHTAQRMTENAAFAWIGAAISQQHFEVGQDVYDAFIEQDAGMRMYFKTGKQDGKYMGDLAGIATAILTQMGVTVINATLCTVSDQRFYSYRDASQKGDARTGRTATLIWINETTE